MNFCYRLKLFFGLRSINRSGTWIIETKLSKKFLIQKVNLSSNLYFLLKELIFTDLGIKNVKKPKYNKKDKKKKTNLTHSKSIEIAD